MGKIHLTRVDDRLIHGQVMTKWSKGLGINAIFIVDNDVAKDDFMKQIFISSGSRSGLSIKVFSTQDVYDYWQEKQFDDYKALLLYKSIQSVYDSVHLGLPIDVLNIGGVSKKKDTQMIISSVNLSESEIHCLTQLHQDFKVEIFFQMLPDSNRINFKDGWKK